MTTSVIRDPGGDEWSIGVGALRIPPEEAVLPRRHLSWGVRQRLGRHAQVHQRIRESMLALNLLAALLWFWL